MTPPVQDVSFDPTSVFDDFIACGSSGTGNCAGRNRCPDLGDGSSAPPSTCFQVVAILRHADRSASGRSGSVPSRYTRSSPATLTHDFLTALVFICQDAVMPDNMVTRHDSPLHNPTLGNLAFGNPMTALGSFSGARNWNAPN